MAFIALAMMYYGVILFLLRKTSLEEAVRAFDNVQLSDLIIKWDRTMIIVYSLTFFLFNIFYFALILGTYWVLPSVWGTKIIYNTLHLYNIPGAPHTEVQKAIKHFYKRSQPPRLEAIFRNFVPFIFQSTKPLKQHRLIWHLRYKKNLYKFRRADSPYT